MRKLFVAGNWKMNNTLSDAFELVNGLKREVGDVEGVNMAICPISICLGEMADLVADSNIKVGAQNIHWE
ncbi:MAG: triose-phosphate isomerase, partial [Victivallaceae bacterium]|nr:triose-phosphate isomerase [Victivallaceae bacterium]